MSNYSEKSCEPENPIQNDQESAPAKVTTFVYRKPCQRSGGKLACHDWLSDIPEAEQEGGLVEVQFKNTRKGYYRNTNNIEIATGDIVAVESSPGHDIGVVTLMGKLVQLQMKKNHIRTELSELKRIYRKAKPNDLEKYEEAKAREHSTMIRARKIAEDLKLNMKIGDVEYQGDCNKAIFYYIADDRVDFRQLIKVLADNFRVRIEMKQIGARQEAGRIGGIGPCGRQLCCSGWMSNFVSVSTSAARYQDISLNPQKLAGQCAKLKCCLNFEVDGYVEAQKKLPSREVRLETKDATYYHFKTDIFKQEMTYSTGKDVLANLVTLSARRVFEIIAMNKRGEKPEKLEEETTQKVEKREYQDIIGQDGITRFDKSKKRNNNRNKNRNNRERGEQQPQGGAEGGAVNSKPRPQRPPRGEQAQGGAEGGAGSSRPRPQRPPRGEQAQGGAEGGAVNSKPRSQRPPRGEQAQGGAEGGGNSKPRPPRAKRPQGERPDQPQKEGGQAGDGGGGNPNPPRKKKVVLRKPNGENTPTKQGDQPLAKPQNESKND